MIEKLKRLHEGGSLTNLASGEGNVLGSSPFSRKRHEATLSGEPTNNPDRAVLNRFLQGIGPLKSVCIKPIDQIKRILPTTPHSQPRSPTLRCAYALIASASAHDILLNGPCAIPRCFEYEGVTGVIENGVARDIVKAGMADLEPAETPIDEAFSLDQFQLNQLVNLYGRDELTKRGLR